MVQISAAIIAASVAIIVAFLTPSVMSLRARRQAVNDRFDGALAALLLVQVARHSPTSMRERPTGWTEDEYRAFNIRMNEKGIEYYVERTAEAKAALTALDRYVPEVRERITRAWELREDDEPALRQAIERHRSAALKSERLFRQRQHNDRLRPPNY